MPGFSDLPFPQWLKDILEPRARATAGGSGLLGAHQIGREYWIGQDFDTKFASLQQFGIGKDAISNGEMLAQAQKGGAALQATNHGGRHPDALNDLQYDPSGQRNTVINELARQTDLIDKNDLLSLDEKNILHRKVAREFYIYQRYNAILNLDQGLLDQIGEGGQYRPRGIANNGADWRSGTEAFDNKTTAEYLRSDAVKDSHLYQNAKNSKLWDIIAGQIPDNGTFDVSAAEKDFAYRDKIRTAIPDYGRIWIPDNPNDLDPRVRASILGNDAHVNLASNPDGTINELRWRGILNSDSYKQVLAHIKDMLIQLAEASVNGAVRIYTSLETVERDFVRIFRTSSEKMAQFASYADTRARTVLDLAQANLDRVPDFVRQGLKKAQDYYSHPDGSINRTRVGLSVAAGVLAVGNVWVEWDRRGGFTPEFATYLKESAKDAISALPYAGAIAVAAMSPLGPAVLFTLGAVATYSAIRNIVGYLASDEYGLDKDGATYAFFKSIDDSLSAFEKVAGTYLGWAKDQLLAGAELSLESVSGRAIEWKGGANSGIVGADNDILIGDDIALLAGDDKNNWLIHRSAGEVYGGAGSDVLIGWLPEALKMGEALERSVRDRERAAEAQKLDWQRTGDPRGNQDIVRDPNAQRLNQDHSLTLDGGSGNDWVIAVGGEKAVTLGGTGRDWIYNTSAGGLLYGDTIDGLDPATGQKVADSKANSDNFWFAPDTTIVDAQHHDVLKFFGLTLTGGDAAASGAALVVGGAAGGIAGASAALAASSLAGSRNRIWFDHLLPFITYKFVAGDEGRTDLLVGNVMDDLFGGLLGKGALLGPLTPDGSPASGVMRIKNFDVVGSTFGSQQSALGAGPDGGEPLGTLNMVFKKANPIAAALGVVGWLLPGGIGFAFQAATLADAAMGIAAASARFAKGLNWAEGSDPLVIDLDGDGIETVSQSVSKAYFDVDGDLFRERAKGALEREVSEVGEGAAQRASGSSAQSIVKNGRAVAVWQRNPGNSGSHRFSATGAANDDDALVAQEVA
jgi:hypothetical protein